MTEISVGQVGYVATRGQDGRGKIAITGFEGEVDEGPRGASGGFGGALGALGWKQPG